MSSRHRLKVLIGCTIVACVVRAILLYGFSLKASKELHNKMLNSVIETKIRFFDLNPIGRIMNRFSKDFSNLDFILPNALFEYFLCGIMCIGSILLTSASNFWLIIPLVPVLCCSAYIRQYFLKSFREVKRIEALCRSPIYVHATNTHMGITTIRACKNEDILLSEFEAHSDYHTRAYLVSGIMTQWYAMRLSLIAVFYTIALMFICILTKGNDIFNGKINLRRNFEDKDTDNDH